MSNEVRMKDRGVRKRLTGVVVGAGMDKTAVILVKRLKKHKSYSKYIRRNSKYLAHDPRNQCHPGDKVKIIESRPISKRKRWQVIEIIEKAEAAEMESPADRPLEQAT